MKLSNPKVTLKGDNPQTNSTRAKSGNKAQEQKLDSGNYGPTQLPTMRQTYPGPVKL